MFSFVTIPTASTTDFTAYIGTLVGDLWVLMALAIGLPLGFWAIGKIVGIVRAHVR
jgi:hypothetical protein